VASKQRKGKGKVVVTVRMGPELHKRLLHRAAVEAVRRRRKVSLNDLCLEALELHDRQLAREAMNIADRVGVF